MTRSMTAFARAGGSHFTWEIRSVNQRHLDPAFRMSDEYRSVEPALREQLRSALSRGKVECTLRVSAEPAGTETRLNEDALRRVTRLIDHVAAMGHEVGPVDPLELLRWPGVLSDESGDDEAIAREITEVFLEAIGQLVAMREREGKELERVVLERLDAFAAIVAEVRANAPALQERLVNRLKERAIDLATDIEPGRLEQELVILAQKADVQEELDRLDTHISEIRTAFEDDGPIGRRLDFLMQELNREANTLSSKSSAAEMSIQAVELKVLIEQMREQIQNIE